VRSPEPDSGSRVIERRTIERETLMHNLRYYSNSHVSIANDANGSHLKEKSNASVAIEFPHAKIPTKSRKYVIQFVPVSELILNLRS